MLLRILLLVNGLALTAVLVRNQELSRLGEEILVMAVPVEFVLIFSVALLFLVQPWLARRSVRTGRLAVLGLVGVAAGGLALLVPVVVADGWRPWIWAQAVAALVLLYFHWRHQTYSPALAEARLQALTARIRPHFLFNSLNGVLGVLRANPRRAEEALEGLADLFRTLMRDNRDLVTLADEITFCEGYLTLERLRLGERLVVEWCCDEGMEDALVPPLMLQPLVENAVCHGIEPAPGPGVVSVSVRRQGPRVCIEISNPVQVSACHHAGNRMALDNIRERLMLFYDLEAGLETEQDASVYRVRVTLPCRGLHD
ncbi:histidine kinase [Zoogloea sp.]|uniref:sensor histidine kinase n=1 Tax=Zoogloea sp. TaxID=49181 RepID=UPI00262004A7|nr:histidine kinase [Zoogloea sp.]MDD3353717.1 histidine kinase [Zoogloea sp.]